VLAGFRQVVRIFFSGSRAGRPPAYIDFPTDLLREEAAGRARRLPDRVPVLPDPDQIRVANEVLHLARRLLVIAGRSARLSGSRRSMPLLAPPKTPNGVS
jgi:thiamine pyrophosphate-dependent acetolactate synthase large subunit-like protein